MEAVLDHSDIRTTARVAGPEGRRDPRPTSSSEGDEHLGRRNASAARRGPSRRLVLIVALALAALIGAGSWYYLQTMDIESTDDAQIARVIQRKPR